MQTGTIKQRINAGSSKRRQIVECNDNPGLRPTVIIGIFYRKGICTGLIYFWLQRIGARNDISIHCCPIKKRIATGTICGSIQAHAQAGTGEVFCRSNHCGREIIVLQYLYTRGISTTVTLLSYHQLVIASLPSIEHGRRRVSYQAPVGARPLESQCRNSTRSRTIEQRQAIRTSKKRWQSNICRWCHNILTYQNRINIHTGISGIGYLKHVFARSID